MGKTGKLKMRKEAAQERLDAVKKKIKQIAKKEAHVKKKPGTVGHVAMSDILEEINARLSGSTTSSGSNDEEKTKFKNIRGMIENYQRLEGTISRFNDDRDDEDPQANADVARIEAELDSLERETGLTKKHSAELQEERVRENILSRIDLGLKREVAELERAIENSSDEFENPKVNLKDAIERAKKKITDNEKLVLEGNTGQTDDEKELAILKWEIEINKIAKQLTDITMSFTINTKLTTFIAQHEAALTEAKLALDSIKNNKQHTHLLEGEKIKLIQILSTLDLPNIKRKATELSETEKRKEYDDDLNTLYSETISNKLSALSIDQQRQIYLEQAAKLAAMENISSVDLIILDPLSNYAVDVPKIFTGEHEESGKKLHAFLHACNQIIIADAFEGPPENVKEAYRALIEVVPDKFRELFPVNLGEQLVSVEMTTPSSDTAPVTAIPAKIEPYIQSDLNEYPSTIRSHDPGSQVTIGDLHGNTLKLIHFLIQEGVIKMSEDDYLKMVDVYKTLSEPTSYKNTELLKEKLQIFKSVLENMEINPNAPRVCLIGDELADRGANDYLTLKMLEKLSIGKVNVDITISNHSIEFIDPFEQNEQYLDALGDGQAISCANLGKLVRSKLVESEEITDIVNNHYKKSVRALTYTLSEDKKTITVFSHAGIGLNTIREIARSLGLIEAGTDFTPPKTPEDLAILIDKINDAFHEQYVKSDKMHTISRVLSDRRGYTIDPTKEPLTFLIWNRNYSKLDRSSPTGYQFNFAHGHDPEQNPAENVFMLDTLFGKPGYDVTDESPLERDGIKYSRTNTILTTLGTARVLALVVDATLTQQPGTRSTSSTSQPATTESERIAFIKQRVSTVLSELEGTKQKIERYKGDLANFSADIRNDHNEVERMIAKFHEDLSQWKIGTDITTSVTELTRLLTEAHDLAGKADELTKRIEAQLKENITIAAKNDDKRKVAAAIERANNLKDLSDYIDKVENATPGFDNLVCQAAVETLGYKTELDAIELQEFLPIAKERAFVIANELALSAIVDSTDNENLMKLLLCDPQDFTNNQFKDALSRIIKNDDVMAILDKNKDDLDFNEILETIRDDLREDIVKKAEKVIFSKPKDDNQILAIVDAKDEENAKVALAALLGDELYKQLMAVNPSKDNLNRLTEAARFVKEGNKKIETVIEELKGKIAEIKDTAQLENLAQLVRFEPDLDDPGCRAAFVNLFKSKPTDQEDPRIQLIEDAQVDIESWFGATIKQAHEDLVRQAVIDAIKNTDGKPDNYADLLGRFIEASDDKVEKRLKAIVGDDLIEQLKLADIDLNDFVEITQEVLAPIALDAARTNLEIYDGNANEYFNFIKALSSKPDEWTEDQQTLIDKMLKDDTANLRDNLVASMCDLSQIIQLAKNKLSPLAIAAAKQAVDAIPSTDAGYNPKDLIDFIKSATSAPPDPTRFDKLKRIIDPVLVEQLKTAGIDNLNVIATQAKDKLREYATDVMLDKLQTANEADLEKLMLEPNTTQGVSPSFKEIISKISGIANFHEIIELTDTGNINQLLNQLKAQRLNNRTSNAVKAATDHIQSISDPAILSELAKLDKTQLIDTSNASKLINLLGTEAGKYLPALISANPKVKFGIFVDEAKRRIVLLDVTKLEQSMALFQGSRDAMMQLLKEPNLERRKELLVQNGIIPSTFLPQLNNINPRLVQSAIYESAKQWVIDNLVKSAKTTIDGISEIDQLPEINTQADLEKLRFKPDERSLFDPADLDRIKLVIEQRREAIALTAGTPSKNLTQLRDVREFITNRATISDLQELQTAVSANDEAKCKKALKRRGFTDESLSELKIADFINLTALISSQHHDMVQQEAATSSAKNNLDHCSTQLELAIRDRDELQRQVDEQLAIISDDNADEDALNAADSELEALQPQLDEAKSKVSIARSDLNHARKRFETADTITKDKQTKLHQAELVQLQAQSKQAEDRVEDRKKLVKAVTDAEPGISRATTAEAEAKRLLDEANAPQKPGESVDDFNARRTKVPDLTAKHLEKERELTEAKRVKTEAERVLSDARALKTDAALQTEFDAAKESVVVHRNQKPKQISDEPKKKAKRQLEEDDAINQNASRTDVDVRKREAQEALNKATKRESKLIARKAELESILSNNPSHGIKQAAKTELTQLQTALEAVRKQINADEALIEGTKPTATKDDRKKLEVEAKYAADEANICMRDYKQAQKYTKDKISIAEHVRTSYMGNTKMLTSLEKLSDNYIVQLEYHAKRGHDESSKDELNAILDKSAKLHAQLEIFKDELNKEILTAVTNKANLLEMLKRVNAALMAIKKAQQTYHVPLAQVGSLCKISNPPICSTEDEINNQIAAIIGSTPGTATGTLSSNSAKINTTATFKDAAGRVTTMELEDGRALRKGTFNAAVVQKCTPEGGFVTIFHVNESDKSRITGNTSLTAGAKLIEEHRLGNHNSSDPIDICGKFPPQMVKDMIAYCEAKGYKYNNLTDTKYIPSAKSISALQQKLDTEKTKIAIFGTAKELGTSKAKVTALEQEVKLNETPVPTTTRPST